MIEETDKYSTILLVPTSVSEISIESLACRRSHVRKKWRSLHLTLQLFLLFQQSSCFSTKRHHLRGCWSQTHGFNSPFLDWQVTEKGTRYQYFTLACVCVSSALALHRMAPQCSGLHHDGIAARRTGNPTAWTQARTERKASKSKWVSLITIKNEAVEERLILREPRL